MYRVRLRNRWSRTTPSPSLTRWPMTSQSFVPCQVCRFRFVHSPCRFRWSLRLSDLVSSPYTLVHLKPPPPFFVTLCLFQNKSRDGSILVPVQKIRESKLKGSTFYFSNSLLETPSGEWEYKKRKGTGASIFWCNVFNFRHPSNSSYSKVVPS